MTDTKHWPDVAHLYAADDAKLSDARKLWIAGTPEWTKAQGLSAEQSAWLDAQGFKPGSRRAVPVPGAGGTLAGIVGHFRTAAM